MAHAPVLLEEAIQALNVRPGGVYVDATFGGGGYTRAILRAAKDVTVVALDRDPDAIARGAALRTEYSQHIRIVCERFGAVSDVVDRLVGAPVDGVVFDLGVSSFQLDEATRGFSFRAGGPLDMRMGKTGPSAADVVNHLSEAALVEVLKSLGEEPQARRIAGAIVRSRSEAPITTTSALADLIERALGGRKGAMIHPATRAFQAFRILVNEELGELVSALSSTENILRPGGRLAVVSFHSLEDRLVKSFLSARSGARQGGSRYMPEPEQGPAPSFTQTVRKAVSPSAAEVAANPRARSAHLRVAERTAAPGWGAFEPPSLAPLAEREFRALAR
jgi:16S rRNA (cytosine1402-N4)-methyltransferase